MGALVSPNSLLRLVSLLRRIRTEEAERRLYIGNWLYCLRESDGGGGEVVERSTAKKRKIARGGGGGVRGDGPDADDGRATRQDARAPEREATPEANRQHARIEGETGISLGLKVRTVKREMKMEKGAAVRVWVESVAGSAGWGWGSGGSGSGFAHGGRGAVRRGFGELA